MQVRPIDSWFTPKNVSSSLESTCEWDNNQDTQTPDTAISLSASLLEGARAIMKKLSQKKLQNTAEAWQGQNRTRYHLVAQMLFCRSRNPLSTRTEASIAIAATYGKGKYFGKKISKWERIYLETGAVPLGYQGKYVRMNNFLEDEELRGFVRERILEDADST